MSWQGYIDDQLIGSGQVSQAAIITKGGVFTSSPDVQLTSEEQHAVENAFENLDVVRARGLRINGQKYFTLHADPRTIALKKGADGAVVVKTRQTFLIAMYQAPLQQAETDKVVQALADYLINAGY